MLTSDMRSDLLSLRPLHSIFVVSFFTSCKGGDSVQLEKSNKVAKGIIQDSIPFISKLNEPWDQLQATRHQYYDFLGEHCYKLENLDGIDPSLIQILKVEKESDLSLFLSESAKMNNLEAIQFVYVNLSNGKIEKVINSLKDKKHLKKLIFNHCDLDYIPSLIYKLNHLETLDLSFNKFTEVPKEIAEIETLSYLRISKNKSFSLLPHNIGDLENLLILDISGTSLSIIPKSIGNLTNLRNLTGNASKINKVPIEIGKCRKLENINLASNNLAIIPSEIGQLTNLRRIDFSSNLIKELPSTFRNLKNVGLCGLSGNSLSIFPPELFELREMYTLKIYDNDFVRIPKEIADLNNLKLLYIDIDKIQSGDIKLIQEKRPNLKIKSVKKRN